ncbi:MAG TPA: flavin reductase [Edaphobacter sp.]|nr:flavin reductase [Edaphobacter sp.]
MPLKQAVHQHLRRLLLGDTDLPAACDIALEHPQHEIKVWLHGQNIPCDVTFRHSIVCASPFTFCIGFDPEDRPQLVEGSIATLRFEEGSGSRHLLGEIDVRLKTILPVEEHTMALFEAVRARNLCISRAHLAAHDLFYQYVAWKNRAKNEVKVSPLDSACNAIGFICPRPVVLVSVRDEDSGSIFPMNLFGNLGGDYFAFALTRKKKAAPLVEQIGRLALSTVPFDHASTVRKLAGNHYIQSIDWAHLPFSLRASKKLGLPIPEFAIRVCELQVCKAQPLGSHTFFLAKILHTEINAIQPEFNMIHGHYAAYRAVATRREAVRQTTSPQPVGQAGTTRT